MAVTSFDEVDFVGWFIAILMSIHVSLITTNGVFSWEMNLAVDALAIWDSSEVWINDIERGFVDAESEFIAQRNGFQLQLRRFIKPESSH